MKIYNYIKNDICEPIAAENRKEADSMFISGFKVETDEVKTEDDKDQFKFDFYPKTAFYEISK